MATHLEYTTPKPNLRDDRKVSELICEGRDKSDIKELTGLRFGYINRYLRERAPQYELDIIEGVK